MRIFHEFIPKSYLCLTKNYSFALFKKDLIAGITVGIIALPLAMAFGISSGVSPERGLFTAIVAGFIISALGGSRVQIGGPTGAFVVLVYDIVQRHGYEGLAISTLIAACLLIVLAICRLGSLIKYVPHPLIIGFTTGLALIIFSAQIKDFFGLKMGSPPTDFLDKWESYFTAFPTFDSVSLMLGVGTLLVILLVRRYLPRIPWGIAAIILATLASSLLHLPVETIQTRFGAIPDHLPMPSLPSFSFPLSQLNELLMDAIAIAFLGGIESLLSCVIADGMLGSRHKSNCELFGQGIANIASVLFGGIPATGAIARTAANVKSGAQTPLAGMIHSLTILLILAFFSSMVSQVPLAALAAILMVVAWNMSEMDHFFRLMKAPAGDVAILVAAFFLTVLVGITFAIGVGMTLASFLFMKRMSEFSKTIAPFQERSTNGSLERFANKKIPEGVEVFEIQGPFFFGTADMLKDLAHLSPKVFILGMHLVPMMDASGMYALKEFYQRCRKQNIALILSGIQPQMLRDLRQFGFVSLIGERFICLHIDAALAKAEELLKG